MSFSENIVYNVDILNDYWENRSKGDGAEDFEILDEWEFVVVEDEEVEAKKEVESMESSMISLTRPDENMGDEKDVGIAGEYKIMGKNLKITKRGVIYDQKECRCKYRNDICVEATVEGQSWFMIYEPTDRMLKVCKLLSQGLKERKYWRKIDEGFGKKANAVGTYLLPNKKTMNVLAKGGVLYEGKQMEWRRLNSKAFTANIDNVEYLFFYEPKNQVICACPMKYIAHLLQGIGKCDGKFIQSRKSSSSFSKGPEIQGDWVWKGEVMRIGAKSVYYKDEDIGYEVINKNTIFVKNLEGESYVLTYSTTDRTLHVGMFDSSKREEEESEGEESEEVGKKDDEEEDKAKNRVLLAVIGEDLEVKSARIEELEKKCGELEKILGAARDLLSVRYD